MSFAQFPLILQAVIVSVFAALIGSFLNVVIYRLPRQLMQYWRSEAREVLEHSPEPEEEETFNIAWPASHCPQCQAPIKAYDNIPIVSYLLLRGRCRHCQQPIALRYPFVELLTVLSALACLLHFGPTLYSLSAFVFCALLITATFIDLDTMLLPDQLTLPLLWLGLLGATTSFWPIGPVDAIIGAAAGYTILWVVYQGFKLATGKEGMGFGDFKLLAALGAWMGWQTLPLLLMLSAISGTLFALAMRLRGSIQSGQAFPFGPYLAVAGLVMLFCGDMILAWYYP